MKNRRQAETQNMIIAMVLSLLVLGYWDYYIEAPRQKAEAVAMKAQAQAQMLAPKDVPKDVPTVQKPRSELISESPRVTIQSPSLYGSLALKGLRIDDLTLMRYRETLDPNSPEVILLSPADAEEGYFSEFGWATADPNVKVPTPDTLWTADGATLTPQKPLTLSWKNPDGLTFQAKIMLDDKYLFNLTQSVTDASGKPVSLQTYAYINRVYDLRKHPPAFLHEGPLGVIDGTLKEAAYKKLNEETRESFEATTGWVGISDKYWLSVIVPPEGTAFSANFSHYTSKGRERYQVDYLSAAAPSTTVHFFAGAKELDLLEHYGAEYHIPLFDRAVDFGFFYWLAEPIFHLLTWFHALVGNFGIAILLLTVVVKGIMYPLASKSFVSVNQMKALQPRMAELRERHKDDKMQMNQAIMELYKREKVNPASGCLPIFIQIPVFFSLYKVLYVTIEMRHAPFFGWIHDLSASDPTNLFTFFGLAPWGEPIIPLWLPFIGGGHLHLGIWPILMCATMIIQQRQSPPPADPTQAKMMKFLPFIFLFMFSGVAAGLVIYWTWSNILSILQQWHIKRTHGGEKKRNLEA